MRCCQKLVLGGLPSKLYNFIYVFRFIFIVIQIFIEKKETKTKKLLELFEKREL